VQADPVPLRAHGDAAHLPQPLPHLPQGRAAPRPQRKGTPRTAPLWVYRHRSCGLFLLRVWNRGHMSTVLFVNVHFVRVTVRVTAYHRFAWRGRRRPTSRRACHARQYLPVGPNSTCAAVVASQPQPFNYTSLYRLNPGLSAPISPWYHPHPPSFPLGLVSPGQEASQAGLKSPSQ